MRRILTITMLLLAAGTTALAAGSSLPKTVSRLLSEVESLGQDIALVRAESQAVRLEGANQVMTTQAEVDAERRRLRSLQQKMDATSSENASELEAELQQVVQQGLASAKDYVRTSLPYRTDERLQELTDLEKALEAGAHPAEVGARLFSFIDDSQRLAKKIGREQIEVIDAEGKRKLVSAMRLGMVGYVYTAENGDVGRTTVDKNGVFKMEPLTGNDAEQVKDALEAMKSGKQAGVFELPLGAMPTTSQNEGAQK